MSSDQARATAAAAPSPHAAEPASVPSIGLGYVYDDNALVYGVDGAIYPAPPDAEGPHRIDSAAALTAARGTSSSAEGEEAPSSRRAHEHSVALVLNAGIGGGGHQGPDVGGLSEVHRFLCALRVARSTRKALVVRCAASAAPLRTTMDTGGGEQGEERRGVSDENDEEWYECHWMENPVAPVPWTGM